MLVSGLVRDLPIYIAMPILHHEKAIKMFNKCMYYMPLKTLASDLT